MNYGQKERLIRLQMNELLSDLEGDKLLVKDYDQSRTIHVNEVIDKTQELSHLEVIEDHAILKQLGYQGYIHLDELNCPHGYRMSK